MDTPSRRKRRIYLFNKQRGRCYWCKAPMKMDADGGISNRKKDAATFDHVNPRGSPQRAAEQARGCCHIVLACSKCNDRRNTEFIRAQKALYEKLNTPSDIRPVGHYPVAPGASAGSMGQGDSSEGEAIGPHSSGSSPSS